MTTETANRIEGEAIDQYRTTADGIAVHRYRIAGTKIVCYDAWMPVEGYGRGASYCHIDGNLHIQIGTDPDPALYDHLKARTDERIAACNAAYKARYAVAHAAIVAMFPEASSGDHRDGEISLIFS